MVRIIPVLLMITCVVACIKPPERTDRDCRIWWTDRLPIFFRARDNYQIETAVESLSCVLTTSQVPHSINAIQNFKSTMK